MLELWHHLAYTWWFALHHTYKPCFSSISSLHTQMNAKASKRALQYKTVNCSERLLNRWWRKMSIRTPWFLSLLFVPCVSCCLCCDQAFFCHHMGTAVDHRLVQDLSCANPVLGDPHLVQESASHFVQPLFISKEIKESTFISCVCLMGFSLCLLIRILVLSTFGQAFTWWIHGGGFFCICTNFVPSLVQFTKFVYNVEHLPTWKTQMVNSILKSYQWYKL